MGCATSARVPLSQPPQRSVEVQWVDAAPGPGAAAAEAPFVVQRTADLSSVPDVKEGKVRYNCVSLLDKELLLFPLVDKEVLILPLQASPSHNHNPSRSNDNDTPSQSQGQSQGQAASARVLRTPEATWSGRLSCACEAEADGGPLAAAVLYNSKALVTLAPSGRCQALPLGNLADREDGWRGCAPLGSEVYFAPFSAKTLLELEVKSGSLRGIDVTQALTSSERSNNCCKWWGLCSFQQRLLFAAPYCAQQLLEFEPQTRRVRGLPLPAGLTFNGNSGDASTVRKFGGLCSLGDAIFCVPFNADQLLIHFPGTTSSSLRDIKAVARGGGKFSAAVAVAGHVVAAPFEARKVLVYCPETDVLSGVDLTPHLSRSITRPSITGSKYVDLGSNRLCTYDQHVFLALAQTHANTVLELAPRRGFEVPPRFASLMQQVNHTPSGAALPRLAPSQIEKCLGYADQTVKEIQEHCTTLEQHKQDLPKTFDDRMRDLQKTFDDEMRDLKTQMEQQTSEVEKEIREVDAQQSEVQSVREALGAHYARIQEASSLLQDTKEGKRCSFWFLQADELRKCSAAGLPHCQDLRKQHGDWFVEKVVGLSHAEDRSLIKNVLVISHRWEEPGAPDPTGLQLREIQKHLRSYPDLELVWYDFWCLPQGQRSPTEQEEFKLALPNVNLLYLSASTLLLVDLSYVSRFWTQFEAWLSMQSVKGTSLAGATDDELRCSIVCIHNAPQSFEATLKALWRDKTTEEAREILAKPDVVVTNASDKAVQLEKLQKLKDLIEHEFFPRHRGRRPPASAAAGDCVILEVNVKRETEPRQVDAKLTPKHLTLKVQGKELINDDFVDDRWLSLEDSYWELEAKTDKAGERVKSIRYILYLRADCPKYITGSLFQSEKKLQAAGDDSDDDTADTRIRTIANLKEPEPRREEDVYFSEEEEFSDYECEGCGSKSVNVMKKAEDREFKVYCNDCPYVSTADMGKEAPSIRRQREIDEARARKKKEKEKKKLAEKLALQDQVPVDLAELEEVD